MYFSILFVSTSQVKTAFEQTYEMVSGATLNSNSNSCAEYRRCDGPIVMLM